MRGRCLLVVAVATALLGAPSRASATGNDGTPVEVDGSSGTPIVVGLVGLAAIGLIGARLSLLGRRRRTRDDARAATAVAADTSAALERRTLRRARVRLSEDPVISALGIPAEREQRPRRRRSGAGRVNAGQPGQPPT